MPAALLLGCGDSGKTSSTGTGGAANTGSTSGSTTTTTTTTTSSSSSSSSSSTGTGMNILPTDKCPGNLIDMPLDTNVSLHGTTIGAIDDYKEFCGDTVMPVGMGAPDVVYQIKVEKRCSFFLNLTEQGTWDAAVAIRQVCDTRNQGADVCINGATHGETWKGELLPGTYYVIVDGTAKNQSGVYDMNLQCLTPKCGDGVINTAEEQCDLGPNPPASSGCGAPGTPNACKLTPTLAADTCADIPTTPSATVNISSAATQASPLIVPATPPIFDTRVAHQDYIASCSTPALGGGPGLDQVFKFVPTSTGKLSVKIGQNAAGVDYCQPPYDQPECWVHAMWFQAACSKQVLAPNCKQTNEACTLATDCCSGRCITNPASNPPKVCSGGYGLELPPTGGTAPDSACVQSTVAGNYVDTITIDATANVPYYLFVQGQTTDPLTIGANGPYVLRAWMSP